jgi:general stress protein YciG
VFDVLSDNKNSNTFHNKEMKMSNQNAQTNRGQNLDDKGRSKDDENSPGNLKNDPERAAEAGRKGGQSSGGQGGQFSNKQPGSGTSR